MVSERKIRKKKNLLKTTEQSAGERWVEGRSRWLLQIASFAR